MNSKITTVPPARTPRSLSRSVLILTFFYALGLGALAGSDELFRAILLPEEDGFQTVGQPLSVAGAPATKKSDTPVSGERL